MPSLISFLTVLVVAVVIASVVSTLYATALRLWESGQVDRSGDAHLIARTGSVICFSLCVAIVLFTLWLIVPQFH
ncbi:hypothetical protein [Pseudoclavibacter sp. 13-3]|uniref:hypothetical protein n=1 Tax=Pseudoclavibacter sp. 13-3 TaxID=2901228 RepID=UPI001E4DCFAF|nr:hypothetical protein [Pseudoclavibacter sp. 13-3]MCD7101503.1 hypothetical protein [Pseudoclavibacter sp. 13-3]